MQETVGSEWPWGVVRTDLDGQVMTLSQQDQDGARSLSRTCVLHLDNTDEVAKILGVFFKS